VRLSARNQIPAKVVAITHGDVIASIQMDANGQRIVASITAEAVRELGIAEGSEVAAIIKASDVMVAVAD
jgi:molybdopterin-binding protein